MGKRVITIIFCLLLGSSIIFLTSCSNNSRIVSAENEPANFNSPASDSSTTGSKASISDSQTVRYSTSQISYFPVQKPGYESQPYPAALANGKLVLDNGYLRLKPAIDIANFSRGLLIIWPPGSIITDENGQIQVLNSEGQCIARVGDNLNIGGGEINNEIVLKYTGWNVPGNCAEPYWLAAPGVYNGE